MSFFDIILNGSLEAFKDYEASCSLKNILATSLDDETCLLRTVISHDRQDILAYLLDNYSYIEEFRTSKQQTIVHLVVSNMSYRILHYFDSQNPRFGKIANSQNIWGESPLHVACSLGNPTVIEYVINMDIDQSITDKWGRTAADVAMEMGNAHLVNDKLSASFTTKTDKNSCTIYSGDKNFSIQSKAITNELFRVLAEKQEGQALCVEESEIIVKTIFTERIEKLNTNNKNSLVASTAVPKVRSLSKLVEYPGDPEFLQKLLQESDVDINGKDAFGLTALHKFASWNKQDLLVMLLERSTIDINAITSNKKEFSGYTALHFAVESRCLGCIDSLLSDKRILLDIKDGKGRTPRQIAQEMALFCGFFVKQLTNKHQ